MTQQNGEPRWTHARHPTNCRDCRAPITRGDPVLRWPRSGALSCWLCGPVSGGPRRPAAGELEEAA